MFPKETGTEVKAVIRDIKMVKAVLLKVNEAFYSCCPPPTLIHFKVDDLMILILDYWKRMVDHLSNQWTRGEIAINIRFAIADQNQCNLHAQWIIFDSNNQPFMHADEPECLTSWKLFS